MAQEAICTYLFFLDDTLYAFSLDFCVEICML